MRRSLLPSVSSSASLTPPLPPSPAPVVLLDDPLAAVDAAVAEHLFSHAICRLLSDRAVLLVTHHPHFAERCSRVYTMEQGRLLPPRAGSGDQLATPPASAPPSSEPPADEPVQGDSDAMRRPSKQLVLQEDKAQGHVTFATYFNYARAGGLPFAVACICLFATAQAGQMASDYMLQYWATRSDETQEDRRYIQRYVTLTLCTTLAALLNSTLFFMLTARANSNLHYKVCGVAAACLGEALAACSLPDIHSHRKIHARQRQFFSPPRPFGGS